MSEPSSQAQSDEATSAIPPPAVPSRLPKVLGDYRIIREVGRGGMGVVFEAEQMSLARRVALKVLPIHAARDAALLERFRREAKAAARLHHTNIVPVYEVGQDGDIVFYAMQFIEGHGLDQLIKQQRREQPTQPIPPTTPTPDGSVPQSTQRETAPCSLRDNRDFLEVARLVRQVAEALAYAHARGIVHRDIKPSNLLLDESGVAWVADFGLAKTEDEGLTVTGALVGTLRYMAPERFRGEGDHRADVYALGLTLYELLALRSAFQHPDQWQLIELVKTTDPPRLRDLNPAIPRDLETIVLKASDKDPARRYQSAEDMAEDLRRFLADEPIRARRVRLTERFRRWVRRNPVVALLLLVIVVGTGAALIGLYQLYRSASDNAADASAKGQKLEAANTGLDAANNELRNTIGQRDQANRNLTDTIDELRFQVYAAQMDRAYQAVRAGHQLLARQILDESLPKPDQTDFRHFEWHLLNRLARPELMILKGHKGAVNAVAYSSDGKRIASSGADGTLRLWDAQDGREIVQIPNLGGTLSLAFSPDGKQLAVPWGDGSQLRRADDGQLIKTFEGPRGGPCIAFSRDGRRLAAAASNGQAVVWNVSDGAMRTMERSFNVGVVAFGAGDTLASAGRASSALNLWDVSTGQPKGPMLDHHLVDRLACSPDGTRLATTAPMTVTIWDVAKRQVIATQREHDNIVSDVVFNRDGTRIASASFDRSVFLTDATTGKVLQRFGIHPDNVNGAAFSPDGNRLVSACADGLLRVWDVRPLEIALSDRMRGHLIKYQGISPDGTRAAVRSGMGEPGLSIREIEPDREVQRIGDAAGWIARSAYSPDGRHLAAAANDGAHIYDAKSGREILVFRGHHAPLTNLVYAADGKMLATSSNDGEVKVWTPDGQELRTMHGSAVCNWGLRFSPHGDLLGGTDGRAFKVWRVATGKQILERSAHLDEVTDLAFTPDGRRVFSAGRDKTIKVWELPGGHEILTLEGHRFPVRRVILDEAGTRLVSLDDGTEPLVWDGRPGVPADQ